jgi:hypothetical protein
LIYIEIYQKISKPFMRVLFLFVGFLELYLATCLLAPDERVISTRIKKVWKTLKRGRKGLRTANARVWQAIAQWTIDIVNGLYPIPSESPRDRDYLATSLLALIGAEVGVLVAIPLLRFVAFAKAYAMLPPVLQRAIALSYEHNHLLLIAALLFGVASLRFLLKTGAFVVVALGGMLLITEYALSSLRPWLDEIAPGFVAAGREVWKTYYSQHHSLFVRLLNLGPEPLRTIKLAGVISVALFLIMGSSFIRIFRVLLTKAANFSSSRTIIFVLLAVGVLGLTYVIGPWYIALLFCKRDYSLISLSLFLSGAANLYLLSFAFLPVVIGILIILDRILFHLVLRVSYTAFIRENIILNKKLNYSLAGLSFGLAAAYGSSVGAWIVKQVNAVSTHLHMK